MKVRIVSKGWENFTGSLGFQAMFRNGVSVEDLNQRQIARIASSLRVVNADTGEQVGPAVTAQSLYNKTMPVARPVKTLEQAKSEQAESREQLAAAAEEQAKADKASLAEAKAKAEAAVEDIVVYSRQELEAIAANEGIGGLREISEPLGVKGRAITELVNEILKAQDEAVS